MALATLSPSACVGQGPKVLECLDVGVADTLEGFEPETAQPAPGVDGPHAPAQPGPLLGLEARGRDDPAGQSTREIMVATPGCLGLVGHGQRIVRTSPSTTTTTPTPIAIG